MAFADLDDALRACGRGDRRALKHIFDLEAPRLLAVAQRIVKRRDLAEEVLQEAFLRIWTKAPQYDAGRGAAQGWLYAIVRNRALTLIRSEGRMDLMEGSDLESLREARAEQQVLDAWHRLDTDERLKACLDGLEENRRLGILLAYVGGYSHGEIAGRLRQPLGTVKSWIRRGLTSLRECMA